MIPPLRRGEGAIGSFERCSSNKLVQPKCRTNAVFVARERVKANLQPPGSRDEYYPMAATLLVQDLEPGDRTGTRDKALVLERIQECMHRDRRVKVRGPEHIGATAVIACKRRQRLTHLFNNNPTHRVSSRDAVGFVY